MACGQESASIKKDAVAVENLINESNVGELISSDVNLVFITTSWCSASKYVLKNTYVNLCDSLKDRLNVLIICASEKEDKFKNYLKEIGVNCSYYLLPKKFHSEFFLEHPDRKRIRHFIKNNLKGYKGLKLKQQFAVPVSLFVNSKLEIISTAPQKVEEIMGSIEKEAED